METTLTEMRRKTKNVSRALGRGEAVTLTEHGHAIGRIRPAAPRRVVTLAELKTAELTDGAILQAVDEARA